MSLEAGDLIEVKKRRKEILWIFLLSVVFIFLTWFEIRLFGISQNLPYKYSIFFLGLVNFNIILFLLLFFLIFRYLVKVFSEKPQKLFGGTLKGKLVAAFVTFSFVPTTLMFLVSVFYINNSFDKWFSEKMSGVLKSSLEVTDAYYLSAKKKNYHFASLVARRMQSVAPKDRAAALEALREQFSLDVVEFYPGLMGQRILAKADSDAIPEIPQVNLEFLQKGIDLKVDSSMNHSFGSGDLVRVIVPMTYNHQAMAIVVSTFFPVSLTNKMGDIAAAYEDFRDTNPLEYPVKSIYLVILVLMTLVIIFGATWFGFYLARQLSIPLEVLGQATKRVARGDYLKVEMTAGSSELNQLIANFNSMTSTIETSKQSLQSTMDRLDEQSRYLQVVVSNVSTGVISIDQSGLVTMINPHAANLLQLDADKYLGKSASEVFGPQYFEVFDDLVKSMKKHKARSIGKEIRVQVNDQQIPLQMTISVLYDDRGNDVGKVLTFDDLSPVLGAQRAAAWTEVARRIAHEIKNPLTPIKLCAERLRKKYGSQIADPEFAENTTMIIDQVDSLKNLVNEFSNFARLPKTHPTLGQLNRILEDTTRLYSQAHRDCEISIQLDQRLPEFKFDAEQLKRVFTNLFDNAIAALAGGAVKKIELKSAYDPTLRIVRITMTDSGVGIPNQLKDRIFEPYVTTKAQGTGLGLAIVKRTIEDHHGFIRAQSQIPHGTKIIIELPVIEQQAWGQFIKRSDSDKES